MQLIKDWQLMIFVLAIAIIEVAFAVPLLAVALVNGDIGLSKSSERESIKNVSKFLHLVHIV